MPRKANKIKNFFLELPLSAIAPKRGAKAAIIIDAKELAKPR